MLSRIARATPLCLLLFPAAASAEDVVDLAERLIGSPYVWGAEGPGAFDCSGLMQYVHKQFDIELPRRAIGQSRVGERVGRLQRGDLLFFSTDTRRSLVTHVGIYEGRGRMIDASKRHGRVRRDNLNESYWVDRFMFARRLTEVRGAGRDAPIGTRPNHRRRTAIRVIETLADVLLRRLDR